MSDTAVIGRIETPGAHESIFYAILKVIHTQGAVITTKFGWQVWLAREYKLENDSQQQRNVQLMQKQLTAIRELKKQLVIRFQEAKIIEQSPHKSVKLGEPPGDSLPEKASTHSKASR